MSQNQRAFSRGQLLLTEDRSVNDIGIWQPNFDRVVLILDIHDVERHRFVGKDDVAAVVKDHLECERSLHGRLVLSILTLKVDIHPFHNEGSA